MHSPRLVPARCAGREVVVALRPSPADHRRVGCPSCGAKKGAECVDMETRGTLWTGHTARRDRDAKLYGGLFGGSE